MRLPWGHEARHCIYCNKVGPRTQVAGGWAHQRCVPPSPRLGTRELAILPATLTDFQKRCLVAVSLGLNGQRSSQSIAGRLKVAWIAANNSMRALKRRGIVDCFPSDRSQWAVRIWFIHSQYREAVDALGGKAFLMNATENRQADDV